MPVPVAVDVVQIDFLVVLELVVLVVAKIELVLLLIEGVEVLGDGEEGEELLGLGLGLRFVREKQLLPEQVRSNHVRTEVSFVWILCVTFAALVAVNVLP